ncbi:MAG: YicC family protein [Kiritimatiellae bacterium]|nr:YicC family protein [Kiritimatiellia bacterium]
MALKSMTGFGRGESNSGALKVTVELSTVNRKQFDCNFSMPRELVCLEAKLQSLIHSSITRGYVKGLIAITAAGVADEPGERELASVRRQIAMLRGMAHELGLADDLTAESLLRLPDALRPSLLPEDPLEFWPLLEHAACAALDNLDGMRLREGAALEQDLRGRFKELEASGRQIASIATGVPASYKATLEKRLAELLGGGAAVDPALLAREVAVFADRCDVSEELTRLASHFGQVGKVLTQGGACGRTLDFLCQELFREINTTGSKANNVEISRLVIEFKAGLEAVREQVQNIE